MLSSLTGALDRRFLLNAVLPSALFWLLLGFVWLADARPARAIALWDAAGAVHLVALVAATGLLACVMAAATSLLLRLAEGYWGTPPGRLLAAWGRRRHQSRLAALAEDPDAYRTIHLRYPLPTQAGEVMPTRFGNILRSAELYPRDRYGIDTAVTWPRLYQVLPERQVSQIAAARGDVDLLVTTAVLAGRLRAGQRRLPARHRRLMVAVPALLLGRRRRRVAHVPGGARRRGDVRAAHPDRLRRTPR